MFGKLEIFKDVAVVLKGLNGYLGHGEFIGCLKNVVLIDSCLCLDGM